MDTSGCKMPDDASSTVENPNGVTTDLTTRQQGTAEMEERRRFEAVLGDLSAAFVRAPANALHDHIQDGLQRLVEFLGIDCCTLVEVSADRSTLHPLYSYTIPGVPSFGVSMLDQQAWYAAISQHGEFVRFSRPDELPTEARADMEPLAGADCHSGLAIPLMIDAEVRYAITFSAFRSQRTWPDELIPRLRLVGEIFVNAISRQCSTEATHRLQQELVHVTRVMMLGELAATLAHEVTRPLAAILSNAQAAQRFLTMEAPQLVEVQEAVDDVITDTRRAAELLQWLRALAKKTDLKRTSVDVNEMIREIIHLVSGEARARKVSILLELQADLPSACGDRVQLQQVVLNFVLNAFEAIAAVADELRKVVVRTMREPSGGITVSVEDSGIGVAEDVLEHMFEPFFSTKSNGMGMGLAISRSIILSHNGRVWATAPTGRGTTMSFSIPTGREEAA